MTGTISPLSGRPSTGSKDESKPWSKVRVWRDESSERGPRYWVQIQRPGSDKLEEYSYRQFIGTPSNIEEDRLIKQEVQRQYRELEKEGRENTSKVAVQSNDDAEKTEEKPPVLHTFEILRIVADRSPTAKDFDPNRHFTVYYLHEGAERHDVPASLDRMIAASPEKFPKDIRTIIKTALCAKYTNLRGECGHQEPPAIAPEAEEVLDMAPAPEDVPTATPEASTGIEMIETAVGTSVGGEAPPVTPAPDEGDVLARQREWLARLQAVQDEQSRKLRPILVQHRKMDTWHPWTECPHKDRIYTAGTLLNEVVFDFDTEDWSAIIQEGGKLLAYLKAEGIPYQLAWSGGKGIHVHVFVDMGSVELDPTLAGHLEDRTEYGLDVPVVVRRALYDHITSKAGVDIKRAGLDPLKVDFSTARKGSMMRAFGCLRPKGEGEYAGGVKTMLDSIPERRPRPGELPLVFPEKIELWGVGALSSVVNDALRAQIQEASREAFTPKSIEGPLSSIPCYAHLRANGAPVGLRNDGALTISLFNQVHGRPQEEARTEVRAYSAACPQPSADMEREHQATLEGVFRRGYKGVSCKHIRGKFGEKICNKDQCPLSIQARTASSREALPGPEGPEVEALWRYTVDPTRKIPLDQLWRWPECFALIGLKWSVPLETCEGELVAALERSGAEDEQVQKALDVVHDIYSKFALGEDKVTRRVQDNIKGCGLKVGEDFVGPHAVKGGDSGKAGNQKETQAEVIIEVASRNGIEPFMDQYEEAYAAIEVKGHREIVRIKSSKFSLWLQQLYRLETNKPPNKESLGQAISTFEAEALFEGEKRPLSLRLAWHEGDLYYDLCDEARRAVRISPSIKPYGWEIVDRPPIIFKREKHMKAQVEPVPSGSWDDLWIKILNFLPEQWVLCKSHVLQLFVPGHPIAFLNPNNRKGAAKTNTAKFIRELVDPSSSPLQELNNPRVNLNDLFEQNFLPIFDNVDGDIKDYVFNKLCRVNTGEASQERELYKNKEQVLYEYQRTAIITSIAPVGTDHPDFVQRTVYVGLGYIPEEERKDEELLKAEFAIMRGQVLGFIFTTLSKALELKSGVHLERRPRMADYAIWGETISRALGEGDGKFIAAYQGSIKSGVEEALNADPLALAIMQLFAEPGRLHFFAPADDLLKKLVEVAKEKSIDTTGKRWPGAANALSRRMREIVDDLKDQGIYYAKRPNSELSEGAQKEGGTRGLVSNRQIMLLIKKESPFFGEIPISERDSNDISKGDEKYRYKSQQTKIGENNDITVFSTPLDGLPSQDEKVAGLRKIVESGKLRANDLERITPEQKATIDRLRKDGQIGVDPQGTLYWVHK